MFRPLTRTTTEPALDSDTAFTFAATGDGRPTLPQYPFAKVSHRMFAELALLRPAFVLYTGDAIWGYGASRQEVLNDLDRFRALAETAQVPLYNCPGNHEMCSDEDTIALYRDQGLDLWGSFDVGPYHFVALNTDLFCLERRVTGEQLEWLRADLAAHRDAAGIFVFMHRPLFSWFAGDFDPGDSEILQELFRTHPVRAVFHAHDHYFDLTERDGVKYMTVAGGGAPMYAQPTRGGFAHYVLVTVGPGGEVDYNVVEVGRLDLDYVAGNDGIEPLTIARVANTTDRDLVFGNLELRVPRLASRDGYRLSVDHLDWDRKRQELPVDLWAVDDLGDGSVRLRVRVPVPTGTAFRVVAEARH